MTAGNKAVGWRQLREFAGVDVSKSFVLSWRMEGETVLIDVDRHLLPEHPFYEKPRPKEKVCIRPAVIEFAYCEALQHDGSDTENISDVAAGIGHGAIETLRRRADGHYELQGDFGNVVIDAERPLLRLKGP